MKRPTLLAIIFVLCLVYAVDGQIKLVGEITVNSIRRVPKSKENNNKSFIEIELHTSNPNGFYVGALYYCLYIGTLKGISEHSFSSTESMGSHIRFFNVAEEDWKKLKNGDPLLLGWGCNESKRFKRSDYERTKKGAVAFLNKKMLHKKK